MKILTIDKGAWKLHFSILDEPDTEVSLETPNRARGLILSPEEVTEVRDWVNERCRELMFQGYLPEAHPTA